MKQFKQYLRSLRKRFGELPARPVAALLSANVKPPLTPRLHWSADTDAAIDSARGIKCST